LFLGPEGRRASAGAAATEDVCAHGSRGLRAAAELTSPGPAAPGASLRWSAPCVPCTGS